jgi:hypothetical protein
MSLIVCSYRRSLRLGERERSRSRERDRERFRDDDDDELSFLLDRSLPLSLRWRSL